MYNDFDYLQSLAREDFLHKRNYVHTHTSHICLFFGLYKSTVSSCSLLHLLLFSLLESLFFKNVAYFFVQYSSY